MFIPSDRDWEKYFKMLKAIGFYNFVDDILWPSIRPYEIEIMTSLYLQVLTNRPFSRHDLSDEPVNEEDNETDWDPSDIAFKRMAVANVQSTFRKRISSLEERGLVTRFSTKKWNQTWQTSPGQHHGSTDLYCLTGKGVLFTEASMHLPFLAYSFLDDDLSNRSIRLFNLCYSFLRVKNRPKWHPQYFRDQMLPLSDYHLHVIKQQMGIIADDFDFFWQMVGPQIALQRNIGALYFMAANMPPPGMFRSLQDSKNQNQMQTFKAEFWDVTHTNTFEFIKFFSSEGILKRETEIIGVDYESLAKSAPMITEEMLSIVELTLF